VGRDTHWTGPSRDHLVLIYGDLKESLTLQITELEGLDSKATTLLSPIGVLLGLGLNIANTLGTSVWSRGLFYLGLLALLVALLGGLMALRLRTVTVAPIASGLWPKYAMAPTEEMLAVECSTVTDAFERNAGLRGRKRPWVLLEFLLLGLGSVLLTAGYAIKVSGILK
jgi:hypothetical protein